jgi:hypothetical protein
MPIRPHHAGPPLRQPDEGVGRTAVPRCRGALELDTVYLGERLGLHRALAEGASVGHLF